MKESSKDLGYEDSRSPNLGQSKESLEKGGYIKSFFNKRDIIFK